MTEFIQIINSARNKFLFIKEHSFVQDVNCRCTSGHFSKFSDIPSSVLVYTIIHVAFDGSRLLSLSGLKESLRLNAVTTTLDSDGGLAWMLSCGWLHCTQGRYHNFSLIACIVALNGFSVNISTCVTLRDLAKPARFIIQFIETEHMRFQVYIVVPC